MVTLYYFCNLKASALRTQWISIGIALATNFTFQLPFVFCKIFNKNLSKLAGHSP